MVIGVSHNRSDRSRYSYTVELGDGLTSGVLHSKPRRDLERLWRQTQFGSSVMTLRKLGGRGLAIGVLGFGIGMLAASPGFAQGDPERNAYFGQTHVHTSWSFDAYVFGTTVTGPEEAYQFALGQPIKHPGGYMVQLKRPLDFQAVTDHAEYVGAIRLANDPGSAIEQAAHCRETEGP